MRCRKATPHGVGRQEAKGYHHRTEPAGESAGEEKEDANRGRKETSGKNEHHTDQNGDTVKLQSETGHTGKHETENRDAWQTTTARTGRRGQSPLQAQGQIGPQRTHPTPGEREGRDIDTQGRRDESNRWKTENPPKSGFQSVPTWVSPCCWRPRPVPR